MLPKMSLPNTELNSENIRKIEDEILLICRHCKTLDELKSAGVSVWEWASAVLNTSPDEFRGEVELHSMDERFPDKFSEEKDHLLKIPIILLERLHNPNI